MKDILIKNAKLITGENVDISIRKGKIEKVSSCIDKSVFDNVVDLKGRHYVSAGWIDIHTHCFNKFKLYSDKPDIIGYKTGVTTVVDAGTSGAIDMEEFYNEAKLSKTNVYAFINISKIGIRVQSELSNASDIDYEVLKDTVKKYKEFIVGVKARMSKSVVGENGMKPLLMAKKFSKELGLPLMVHIGTEPPTIEEVLNTLENGDIVSHIFNGKKNGILDNNKALRKAAIDAKNRGVIFDMAHGKDSFNFEVAKVAFENDIKLDTISTDIYIRSRVEGPVFDFATTMDKALHIGYTATDIIDMVTVNAAKAIGLTSKGKLEIGYDGDLTIFDIVDEEKELIDSNGFKVIGKKIFKPRSVVLNGEYIEI